MRTRWRGRARSAGLLVVGAALIGLVGCQGGGAKRRLSMAEPPLMSSEGTYDDGGGTTVVAAPPSSGGVVTFADRHPLLSKPRQYYESTPGTNKVVKTAAATVIGVPAGIVGEMKQIFVGRPRNATY